MAFLGLSDMEERFATQWASNSESAELIKGFRIVLAEMRLSPFDGGIVRDPNLFDEPWAKQRRGEYILKRMAFVQEVFSQNGFERPAPFIATVLFGMVIPNDRLSLPHSIRMWPEL